MKTSRNVLSVRHTDTLRAMRNLVSAYHSQGQERKAEKLELEMLITNREVLGVGHPDTLRDMGNLASTYLSQGQERKAEELGVEVLKTSQEVLGVARILGRSKAWAPGGSLT
ncbi:MAG: hypothetical protein M1832_002261 [Thelocarpon impressellum]|nr:MAG: hypothetical protein M1832_002261 [Thelocarpon impressellum]